jgi:hypothetical protein
MVELPRRRAARSADRIRVRPLEAAGQKANLDSRRGRVGSPELAIRSHGHLLGERHETAPGAGLSRPGGLPEANVDPTGGSPGPRGGGQGVTQNARSLPARKRPAQCMNGAPYGWGRRSVSPAGRWARAIRGNFGQALGRSRFALPGVFCVCWNCPRIGSGRTSSAVDYEAPPGATGRVEIGRRARITPRIP